MKRIISICILLLANHSASAAELLDPLLRDDDISATAVNVAVSRDNAGNYIYLYSLSAGETNTGKVLSFVLDIACEDPVDAGGFNPQDYQTSRSKDLSEDIPHVPAAIDVPYGQAASPTITVDSLASWGVALNAGEDAEGLKVVSPRPPGDRAFKLVPSVDYRWDEYDYEAVMGVVEPELIPWTDDWTVTGVIAGPACPGQEYPDDGDGSPRFAGTLVRSDREDTNELLTYSAPLVDQFGVEDGASSVEMTIHYAENIDPKTFRVTPASLGLAKLFHPEPGGAETVTLPLTSGKNRIQFQVKAVRDEHVGGVSGKAPKAGVREDKDIFVIRVPALAEEPPGKGQKK